jgi:hypothetical protein
MEDPMIKAYADLLSRLPKKRLSKEEIEGFAKSFARQEACAAAPDPDGVAKETGARMIGAAAAAAERRQKKRRG